MCLCVQLYNNNNSKQNKSNKVKPESVDDPAERRRVEEAHRRTKQSLQHSVVNRHCSGNCSIGEHEGAEQEEDACEDMLKQATGMLTTKSLGRVLMLLLLLQQLLVHTVSEGETNCPAD